ncbi:MAG: cupin domain-containing protein [Planctomycetes bacterium]|nr:cupin domain-containing protein [Planctomycetota bacterium]
MNTYDIHLDLKYKPLEVCDAGKIADNCGKDWWNQSLVNVNESVIRVGVFLGEFHWHKHDREDEFFWVIDGLLLLDLETEEGDPFGSHKLKPGESPKPGKFRTVELSPRQGLMVPKGVVHRTRAKVRTTVLMVEPATVKPTGD